MSQFTKRQGETPGMGQKIDRFLILALSFFPFSRVEWGGEGEALTTFPVTNDSPQY
jgi:hypothetical protein